MSTLTTNLSLSKPVAGATGTATEQNTNLDLIDRYLIANTLVTQVAHGFTTGTAIYNNAGTWARARANADSTMASHVALVLTVDSFFPLSHGRIPSASHGLTVGTKYYLSSASAGAIVTSNLHDRPQYILTPIDANNLWINIDDYAPKSRVEVYRNASQSINNATYTKVQFNTETQDISSEFDSVTNYRFTTTTPGEHLIEGSVEFDTGAGNHRNVEIYLNGATSSKRSVIPPCGGGIVTSVHFSYVLNLVVGDYVEIFCYQDSGGAINILANFTRLKIVKIL